MKLDVIEYTTVEGGGWHRWDLDLVSDTRLHNHPQMAALALYGYYIHALRLSDGRVWDCINGWRP